MSCVACSIIIIIIIVVVLERQRAYWEKGHFAVYEKKKKKIGLFAHRLAYFNVKQDVLFIYV